MRLADLRNRTVVVWGTGREGQAAVRAVTPVRPAALTVVDEDETATWTGELAAMAPLVAGPAAFDRLAGADVVIRSPGVPQTHPWVAELRRDGVPITGSTALWMAEHAARTVGVTGSKGKSTTSSLIAHLLAAVDRPNLFGGNIGVPVLDLPEADRYVLELSSYQCADLTVSPRVAVVTSLFPEHLDAHGGEREYYRDKLNLLAHDPELVVYNAADPRLAAEIAPAASSAARVVAAAADDSTFRVAGEQVLAGDRPLFARSRLPLVGRHNERNLAVALAVLDGLGVDVVAEAGRLADAVADFAALPHRLAEIADPSGLTFVDDTLATSPYATMHAIDAYAGRPLTVIVGGTDRGLDYTPLAEHLAEATITVIGIPDSGPRIVQALTGLPSVRVENAEDLAAAVALARKLTPSDGVVLLSPAAPSYGRFRNFEHRSAAYADAIRATA